MSKLMPESEADMLKITHVTQANYIKYGAKLLEITSNYSAQKLGTLESHFHWYCLIIMCFFLFYFRNSHGKGRQ